VGCQEISCRMSSVENSNGSLAKLDLRAIRSSKYIRFTTLSLESA
jgi:hypothetical protein